MWPERLPDGSRKAWCSYEQYGARGLRRLAFVSVARLSDSAGVGYWDLARDTIAVLFLSFFN